MGHWEKRWAHVRILEEVLMKTVEEEEEEGEGEGERAVMKCLFVGQYTTP